MLNPPWYLILPPSFKRPVLLCFEFVYHCLSYLYNIHNNVQLVFTCFKMYKSASLVNKNDNYTMVWDSRPRITSFDQ